MYFVNPVSHSRDANHKFILLQKIKRVMCDSNEEIGAVKLIHLSSNSHESDSIVYVRCSMLQCRKQRIFDLSKRVCRQPYFFFDSIFEIYVSSQCSQIPSLSSNSKQTPRYLQWKMMIFHEKSMIFNEMCPTFQGFQGKNVSRQF